MALYLGKDLVSAFSGSGGTTIKNQDITVTENGTYTAENGYTGLGTVTVDVPTGGGENKLASYFNGTVTEITAEDFGGATKIADSAFDSYTNLTSVTIPDSVTKIGSKAFKGCRQLTNLIIPDSVTSIGSYAFQDCKSLKSVTIPDSVTKIEMNTFYGCGSLGGIIIPDSVTSIGSYAFSNCGSLTNLIIPDSVTEIGSNAFQYCYGLKSVTFHNGVKITYNAFKSCTSMEVYDFTACTSVPVLGNANVFEGIPSTCQIRVPASLYDEWIAATNWSNYASNIVAV